MTNLILQYVPVKRLYVCYVHKNLYFRHSVMSPLEFQVSFQLGGITNIFFLSQGLKVATIALLLNWHNYKVILPISVLSIE